eukprot:m51a1_g3196 putative craniofacial development protein 1 (278) ;mRNA; f:450118-451243
MSAKDLNRTLDEDEDEDDEDFVPEAGSESSADEDADSASDVDARAPTAKRQKISTAPSEDMGPRSAPRTRSQARAADDDRAREHSSVPAAADAPKVDVSALWQKMKQEKAPAAAPAAAGPEDKTSPAPQDAASPVAEKPEPPAAAAADPAASSSPSVVTEVYEFAGEKVVVTKPSSGPSPAPVAKPPAAGGKPAAASAGQKRPASALSAILGPKPKKLTTLEKSKLDWQKYRTADSSLADAMDKNRKSSGSYLDKIAFLQRADVRQYEAERKDRSNK